MPWAISSHYLLPPTTAGSVSAPNCPKLRFSHVKAMYGGTSSFKEYRRGGTYVPDVPELDTFNPIEEYGEANQNQQISNSASGLRLSTFHSAGKENVTYSSDIYAGAAKQDRYINYTMTPSRKEIHREVLDSTHYSNAMIGLVHGDHAVKVDHQAGQVALIIHNKSGIYGNGGAGGLSLIHI